MNITTFLLFGLMSLVIGAVLMILLQYYFFIRYGNMPEESLEQRDFNLKYNLPDTLLETIRSADSDSKLPIVAINLIMQFLFHELKDTNRVRKWFYRKLTIELDELITKTTTGKLLDKLTIRDLDLGGQFPEIKNIRVHNVELHDTDGHIENLDLLLELKYRGNFRLVIDADMVLGKKGSLNLKVKCLSGLARLQFTRKPYTHWSLSFLGDPQLELDVESQFQGRQMQSNVTNLIVNQIRKAIRRKHTLPNYKLRYKPFFQKVEEDVDCDFIPNGRLDVNVKQLSRLMLPPTNAANATTTTTQIYCILTLASLPWVEARQRDDRNVIISIDTKIHKAKNQQIGIVFVQSEMQVSIEAILPNTPAVKAGLRKDDVLISIEGKRVSTINQVAKIVKNLNRPILTLRVERVIRGFIRNDAIFENNQLHQDQNFVNPPGLMESSPSLGNQQDGLRQRRKDSTDKLGGTSSESSVGNTPTSTPKKSQESLKGVSRNPSRENNENNSSADELVVGPSSRPNSGRGKSTTIDNYDDWSSGGEIEVFQQHSTIDCDAKNRIKVGDLCAFVLNENSNFINLCVYGRSREFNQLLGYANISVRNIIAECSDTSLGNYVRPYSLSPPITTFVENHSLSMQNGFEPNLCFGDVLMSFDWTGIQTMMLGPSDANKKNKSRRSSTEKQLDEPSDRTETPTAKQHNFVRTHFHRATQCDYCGKKIWLKDAVQCRDCAMTCHKKCVTKCQASTVCGGTAEFGVQALNATTITNPEFRVTQAANVLELDPDSEDGDEVQPKLESHRQSFSDLLAQGLKRVNSANNLAIPGIVSSLGQNSRSLPPSPQHTPSINPFVTVTQRLEMISDDVVDLTKDQISSITEALIEHTKAEDMMSLAKSSSKALYADLEPNERVEKINKLLSKLRIALDSETHSHSNLVVGSETIVSNLRPNATESSPPSNTNSKVETIRASNETNIYLQTKPPPSLIGAAATDEDTNRRKKENSEHEMARRAILIAQSEERVHALSVIMLYLCTGLQHAQGVASQ